ncbi:unnamed protein product, partial [Ectocarpus sp. 12 AP-2014]
MLFTPCFFLGSHRRRRPPAEIGRGASSAAAFLLATTIQIFCCGGGGGVALGHQHAHQGVTAAAGGATTHYRSTAADHFTSRRRRIHGGTGAAGAYCSASSLRHINTPRRGGALQVSPRPRGTKGDIARRDRDRNEEVLREAQQQEEARRRGTDPMKVSLGSGGLEVCRIINGLCQAPLDDTSGDPTDALRTMDRLAEMGLTTFMLGNGAGGGRALAESRAGSYLKSAAGAASGEQEVSFLNTLSLRRGVPVTRKTVKSALELSLRRMGVERLDLVQLCWRDFEDRYFLDALYYLEELEWVSNVGVCGFPGEPLALAAKNGFTVVSNLVASSLIKAPMGRSRSRSSSSSSSSSSGSGSSRSNSSGSTGLARQCREQGVALIAAGASLGGFAAEEWLYRSAPSVSNEEELPLASRQALSDIFAWGRSNGKDDLNGDPWALYQNKLLPELQAVARKHGGGISPADVATAFHLYREPVPRLGSSRTDPGTASGTRAVIPAAAVSLPVRVNSAGSVSARRAAEADEDRVAGRRGAELADALDPEDIQRIAAAVGAGSERETIRVG